MIKIKNILILLMIIFMLAHNKIIDIQGQNQKSVKNMSKNQVIFYDMDLLSVLGQEDLQEDDKIIVNQGEFEDQIYYEVEDRQGQASLQIPQKINQQSQQSQKLEYQEENYQDNDFNNDQNYLQFQDDQYLENYGNNQQKQYQYDYDYEEQYGGQFENQQEKTYRIQMYQRNLQEIQEHNRDPEAMYQRGDTGLMYYDPKQFVSGILMDIPTRPPQAGPFLKAPPGFQIRPVDWRNHMGKPGEQMSICSSCYAFAVTSLIQAYYSIQKGGELINFSEQQLVDCCNIQRGCFGCDGGFHDATIQYISRQGLQTAENYPYIAQKQKCMLKKGSKTIKILDQEQPYNQVSGLNSLHFAISKGPVSVTLDATLWDSLYKKGIFNSCPKNNFSYNHIAVLSGYQQQNRTWIVRNSWGPKWGENGYIYLPYGNSCGIADRGVIPNLLQRDISPDGQNRRSEEFIEQNGSNQDEIFNQNYENVQQDDSIQGKDQFFQNKWPQQQQRNTEISIIEQNKQTQIQDFEKINLQDKDQQQQQQQNSINKSQPVVQNNIQTNVPISRLSNYVNYLYNKNIQDKQERNMQDMQFYEHLMKNSNSFPLQINNDFKGSSFGY